MERRHCEFFLVRYVPDTVRGEFINIGIILHEMEETGSLPIVRFTRNWGRVRCLDPVADIDMLLELEQQIARRLAELSGSNQILLSELESSLSLSLQISQGKATLAADLNLESDRLMQMYVEPRFASNPSSQDPSNVF